MNKVGFEYEYKNVYDVLRSLELESSELFILPIIVAIFVVTYLLIHKYGPMYYIYLDYKKQEKIKRKKKQFIERIKLQSEIENEVEKDLK